MSSQKTAFFREPGRAAKRGCACGVWPGWMLAGSPEASLPESWSHTLWCVHTQTHLHRAQGTAWGGSHTRQHDVVVTGLSRCMGRAAGSPPLPWDWRCCRALQTAAFDAQMEQKKKKIVFISTWAKKRKCWGFLNYFCGGMNAFHFSTMQWFTFLGTQKANLLSV